MSELKFTPGPWKYREDIKPSEHGTVEVYHEEGKMWIASVLGTHVGPNSKNEVLANAKLIASAPDLFEALRLALPYIEGAYECAFPDSDQNEYVLNVAKAAIAKSIG